MRQLWPGLLLLACVLSARGEEVNFKIGTFVSHELEGGDHPRPAFTVGGRRISFHEPAKGRLTSEPAGLAIYVADRGMSGEIRIVNSSFRPKDDFTEKIEDYHLAGEATLPKEAEKPELLGAKTNLYPVNGWKSLGFEWKYSYVAHATHRGVTWMNLDAEHQVCISIVSDEDFWAETAGLAKRFLLSWYWADGGR